MDFYTVATEAKKKGEVVTTKVFPNFLVRRCQDLMIRGGGFYAVWDAENDIWCTEENRVAQIVDASLRNHIEGVPGEFEVSYMQNFNSRSWSTWKNYSTSIPDSYNQLDNTLIFSNSEVKKTDYASKRLPYALEEGDFSAWDELVGVLYSPEEREKIEWAIGAVVSGDAKKIQKFLVLYGTPGTGKGTILNIIHQMFYEYTAVFEAKALGSSNNQFATDAFRHNPLVAIQHDGDLSKIEDNTKLNSIIAHEDISINEKFKSSYMGHVNAMLFMGTNQPVKISDARSGIIRRLIDVNPSGLKVAAEDYQALLRRISFEHGAIAYHCLQVYKRKGKHYYDGYRPTEMMYKTDAFFNFVEAHYDVFSEGEGISLKRAWTIYKEYTDEARLPYSLPMSKFREALKDYFASHEARVRVDGVLHTHWFSGFDKSKFDGVREEPVHVDIPMLVLDKTESMLDRELSDMPAQLAKSDGTPKRRWTSVETTLKDVDTHEVHYVKVPTNHIVIDFDLKDEHGNKSAERNLEAASEWPLTYAEFSRGGGGIHLHYNYEGDPNLLRVDFSDGIEVKSLLGDASLRRRLTLCNDHPIATLNGGLPLKEKKMLDVKTIQTERGLRALITRNLHKEIHPGTKPSMDFIHKILEDAYSQGLTYDVSDMRPAITAFANNSSNQALASLKIAQNLRYKSEEETETTWASDDGFLTVKKSKDDRIVFYDVEVYPNLFVVCWKYQGADTVTRMINPTSEEVEQLMGFKLVGFNNRRYDNHILYARFLGYNNQQLYDLSQKIIDGKILQCGFGEAYNLSYTDIYDFSSKKQGLKKFGIELGLAHVEMDIPWDQDVPDDKVDKVVEYCVNDVNLTEAVFEARKQDFVARQILADLSDLSVNDTTQKHTGRIIFGKDPNPQRSFVYTDLSKEFDGYAYELGKSSYRGECPSEGGYVYAEPGLYDNVAVLDVASMHPTSIECLGLFGPEYTPKFAELKEARVAIKRRDYARAKRLLDGRLEPYLKDESDAKELSYALKIVINIVYGLTSAKFPNLFKDNRNVDNIVAKRGALFMIDLKHYVQEELKLQVVHIKTDSIKIPNASDAHIQAVMDFGAKYGYEFEHEATYDKFCLVNDAVYVAREGDKWETVGAQFQHPFVKKSLFTFEEITFNDMCETKQVSKGSMYLDLEYDRPMITTDGMQFVGRTGRFTPVTEGGGMLYRVCDGKTFAVTGTKGYLWAESTVAQEMGLPVDMSYFDNLVLSAKKTIGKFGSYEELVS